MSMDLKNEQSLKSYLLGDLNPDEQQRLEKDLMTDDDAFEQLNLIEDELIDDYLEGALSNRDREKFESFFLAAPEQRQKLRFAKSLKLYVAENKPEKSPRAFLPKAAQAVLPARNPVLKWALAASLALLVGGGFWSIQQISKLQVTLDDERVRSSRFEQEVANLKKIQKSSPSLLPGEIQPILLLASLSPGRRGSPDGYQEIIVPSGEGLVQLDLIMEPLEYPRYQVTLERDEGDEFRTQAESTIQGPFSGLSVSTRLLTGGIYILRLRGITTAGEIENIGSYYFRAIIR